MNFKSNQTEILVAILSIFGGVEFVAMILYVAFSIAVSAARIY